MSEGPIVAPTLSSKEELELEKLRLDIRFARRSFALQLANFISLVCMALVVFYFFQRPQVQTMEATRVASEKHQVAQLVIAAQAISNEPERLRVLDMLAEQYPSHTFVVRIARSVKSIAEASTQTPSQRDSPAPMQAGPQFSGGGMRLGGDGSVVSTVIADCGWAPAIQASLSGHLRSLTGQLEDERSRSNGSPGDVATIGALQIAIANVESRIKSRSGRCAETAKEIPRMRGTSPPASSTTKLLPTPTQMPPTVALD